MGHETMKTRPNNFALLAALTTMLAVSSVGLP
jgi:hypothetical protein